MLGNVVEGVVGLNSYVVGFVVVVVDVGVVRSLVEVVVVVFDDFV